LGFAIFAISTSVTARVVVARDDNWGKNNFTDLKDLGDNKAGTLVATGVVINDPGNLGGIRLDNDLNVAVDPTNSDIVYIVWCDNAGPAYTCGCGVHKIAARPGPAIF
jgi:hypothetical protein